MHPGTAAQTARREAVSALQRRPARPPVRHRAPALALPRLGHFDARHVGVAAAVEAESDPQWGAGSVQRHRTRDTSCARQACTREGTRPCCLTQGPPAAPVPPPPHLSEANTRTSSRVIRSRPAPRIIFQLSMTWQEQVGAGGWRHEAGGRSGGTVAASRGRFGTGSRAEPHRLASRDAAGQRVYALHVLALAPDLSHGRQAAHLQAARAARAVKAAGAARAAPREPGPAGISHPCERRCSPPHVQLQPPHLKGTVKRRVGLLHSQPAVKSPLPVGAQGGMGDGHWTG